MFPYPSERMVILAEYDRGYFNGQRDILEQVSKEVRAEMKGFPPSADEYKAFNVVLEIIDKYRGR